MQETAEMLNQATSRSLVILDEVGRGTSTYDGMSLAQSILEYFLRKLKSFTFFSTHYHELTHLEARYPGRLINRHMAIQEGKGDILFRYHLSPGPAKKSYGIQVAQRAGLPPEVVQYARLLLKKMEAGGTEPSDQLEFPQLRESQNLSQVPLGEAKEPELNQAQGLHQESLEFLDRFKEVDVHKLTPLEALNRLAQWQQELS